MNNARPRKKIDYVKFIHCKTPQEVYKQVPSWSSNLSEHEHMVRSVILDIHATIESGIKEILFLHMAEMVVWWKGPKKEYEASRQKLEKTIQKMSFSQVYRLLCPCFEVFQSKELTEYLPAIDTLRNEVAHRSGKAALYKGRSPFSDHDCFAQLYVDSWAINLALGEFIERRIDDPKAMKERGWLHFVGKLK